MEVHNVEKKVKTMGHMGRGGPFVSLMVVTRKNILFSPIEYHSNIVLRID